MMLLDAYNDTIRTQTFHQTVAEMAEIPRSQAKTINLGLVLWYG
jgi:hypothetical protein